MQNLSTFYSLKMFNNDSKLMSKFYNYYCAFLPMVTTKTSKLQN